MTTTKKVVIEATERKNVGKSYAHKLRKAGKIPAVLNGQGKSTMLELDPKLLPKAWQNEGHKFDLKVGSSTKEATITDLQIHPIKRYAIHVDLAYV